MREKMHPIYTAVPARSVRAYANSGYSTLEQVLCAVIVDPDSAEDAFEEYGVEGTPHSMRDFFEWRGAIGVDLALQVAAQWMMQQDESQIAIRQVISWDHRIGVWCACQVAREALRYVPQGEERPRAAIEAAERWAAGDATIEEVRDAATAVTAYTDDADFARAARAASATAAYAASDYYAYSYAANAAEAARAARLAADAVIVYAASAAAYANARTQAWRQARDAELVRLREVIANACMTFPR